MIPIPPPPVVALVPPPPPPPTVASIPPPPVAAAPAPPARVRQACDTECYIDYWLCKFMTLDGERQFVEFEMYPGKPLDIVGLRRVLSEATIYTFNGINYDMPMIAAALMGYDCAQLKWLSDQIIQQGLKTWDIERQFKIYTPAFIDHVDMIEILPGQHGLKMYMAKMHSKRIQELPIDPAASITPELRERLRTYCSNDLIGVQDATRQFKKELALREQMSAEYGIDLRSKSDAQIAEAVIKHELGFYVERPVWAAGTWFHFDPPAFLEYKTPQLQQLLQTVRTARFVLGPNGVDLPFELDADANPAALIKIGISAYALGIGGLHSREHKVFHVTNDDCLLEDIDVESYYPRLMLNSGMFPPQMGEAFIRVYESIVERRIVAKRTGDKSTADSLKITINGTFGKTLSKYGILSAPKFGIQTTVSGQLSILMLIETLELAGIPVVSANTDGIVVKCPRRLLATKAAIVSAWEQRTGLKTEANEYDFIGSRDVNNYVAIKSKDKSVKLKGAYAPPVPVGGSWPNPGGEVCVDAIREYLLHRTPLELTICACDDIRKFVYVRNVKGGGVKYYGHEIEAAKTKKGMREQLARAGWVEYGGKDCFMIPGLAGGGQVLDMKTAHKLAIAALREENAVPKEYLGKVVRWYYGRGQVGAIHYKTNGNLVPCTEGAKPAMELPDAFPNDIDYEWYIREAKSMLADIGVSV